MEKEFNDLIENIKKNNWTRIVQKGTINVTDL